METLEAIFNRRSIRDYTDELVTDAEIEILLRAAFSAPTAANTQPVYWQKYDPARKHRTKDKPVMGHH